MQAARSRGVAFRAKKRGPKKSREIREKSTRVRAERWSSSSACSVLHAVGSSSTARDASVAGMERKDEVGHATSALVLSAIARTSPKARTLLRYRHDLFHLIHPSFVPQEGISVVSDLNRRSFEHLHLAVVLTSTRSGMRSSAARMHALAPNGSGPVPSCGRRTEEDGAC